jgi:electron transfer flavoprotein beta subunit
MAAKSKPIEEKPAAAAEPRVVTVAMRKPPAKSSGRILGTDKTAVPELVRLLHDEAKVI